jgi:hypothetical protein
MWPTNGVGCPTRMFGRTLSADHNKPMWGRRVVLPLVTLVTLLAPSAPTSAAELSTIRGEWVGNIAVEGDPGDPCDDPSGVLVPGNTVELTDADGAPLRTTDLRGGATNNEGVCSYGFSLWGVPERDANYLGVSLGGRGEMDPVQVTRRTLDANSWVFEATLRTSWSRSTSRTRGRALSNSVSLTWSSRWHLSRAGAVSTTSSRPPAFRWRPTSGTARTAQGSTTSTPPSSQCRNGPQPLQRGADRLVPVHRGRRCDVCAQRRRPAPALAAH